MSKSRKFSEYQDDNGEWVTFSSVHFKSQIDIFKEQKRASTGTPYRRYKFYEEAAAAVGVEAETVKKWDLEANGPGSLETIKKLALFMGIDYHNLLVDKYDVPITAIDEEKFKFESNNEKDFILQMYHLFVDYIYWFTGCQNETKAEKNLEDYWDEKEEYIANLYRLLDNAALMIAEDVYLKIRKCITELEQLSHVGYSCWIPNDWTDINPFLLDGSFNELIVVGRDGFDDLIDGYNDDIGHMLFEDMPELHVAAEEPRKRALNNLEIEELSDLAALVYDGIIVGYDVNTLVCREFAHTLIKVMKKRFSQYF